MQALVLTCTHIIDLRNQNVTFPSKLKVKVIIQMHPNRDISQTVNHKELFATKRVLWHVCMRGFAGVSVCKQRNLMF